jgi:hypothetical protein
VSTGLAAASLGTWDMSGRWTSPGTFFSDADFDFETRATLGRVANGAGNVGLVFATLDQITDGDAQSWFDAWTATASTLAARGDDGVKRGQLATASWAMLTAASYYAKALAMVDGLADQSALLPTFREQQRCWEAVIDASQGRFVRVPVPYEGSTLPGLMGEGAVEALNRGWNAL